MKQILVPNCYPASFINALNSSRSLKQVLMNFFTEKLEKIFLNFSTDQQRQRIAVFRTTRKRKHDDEDYDIYKKLVH